MPAERLDGSVMAAEMLLSVSTAVFDGYPFARAFEEIAGAGARHVEPAYIQGYTDFDESGFSEISAAALARAMADAGLSAFAVSAHVNAGMPEAPGLLARRLRFARAIGARFLISNSAPRSLEDAFFRNIEAILPVCEETGVVLALENPGHGTGNLIGNGAEGAAVAARIGSPSVRLNYDVGNVFTYSQERLDPVDDLPNALPCLAHLHAKDVGADAEGWRFTAVGEGAIDYAALVKRLPPDVPVGLELPLRLRRPGRADPVRNPDPLPLPAIVEAVRTSLANWQRFRAAAASNGRCMLV